MSQRVRNSKWNPRKKHENIDFIQTLVSMKKFFHIIFISSLWTSCGVTSWKKIIVKTLCKTSLLWFNHAKALLFYSSFELNWIELNWHEMNKIIDEDNSVHDDYIIGICVCMYGLCTMLCINECCHHSAFCPTAAASVVATPVLTYCTVDVVSGMLFSSSFMCSHRIKHTTDTNRHSSSTLLVWTRLAEQVKPTEFCETKQTK